MAAGQLRIRINGAEQTLSDVTSYTGRHSPSTRGKSSSMGSCPRRYTPCWWVRIYPNSPRMSNGAPIESGWTCRGAMKLYGAVLFSGSTTESDIRTAERWLGARVGKTMAYD